MGVLFVVEYEQTQDSRFFLCATCNTHLVRLENWVGSIGLPTVFENAVNLVIDPPEHHYEDHTYDRFNVRTRVAKVYCVGCNTNLGKKFLHVDPPDNNLLLREGRFQFDMAKLRYWNGQNISDVHNVMGNLPQVI